MKSHNQITLEAAAAVDKTIQTASAPFLCRYYHDGVWWSLTVHAYDRSDAEARCKKMGLNLDGEIMATIPAKIGWVAKMVCFFRNLFGNAA